MTEQGRPIWPADTDWDRPVWDTDGQPISEEAHYIEDMELYAQALEQQLKDANTEIASRREQLRWAWAQLGCRCVFDDTHVKTHEDPHCPVHGSHVTKREGQPTVWEQLVAANDTIRDLTRQIATP